MTDFSGNVLRPVRIAPSNSSSTSEADNGVIPQVEFVGSTPPGGSKTFVEPHRDKYRAAVLAHTDTEEYLVWAANSSSLAVVEDPSWAISEGITTILDGALTVGLFEDGTNKFLLRDGGDREIAGVVDFTFIRGDDPGENPVLSQDVTLTSTRGVVQITDTNDYLSNERGDSIIAVRYFLSSARFWWTRNDQSMTRFAWNGASQRWESLRGGVPITPGKLELDRIYTLSPKPQFPTGTSLPGDGTDSDLYSMIRIGPVPDSSSQAIGPGLVVDFTTYPSGVLVVANSLVSSSYTFTTEAAIVGSSSGKILFNPVLVADLAGTLIWYSQRNFSASTGEIGDLLDTQTEDLFIAPIPGPTERPIITLGSRRPLTVLVKDTDAELFTTSVSEGEVGISLSTGKLKFSAADITKADPGTRAVPNLDFELPFFGTPVNYLGITGNQFSQPMKPPVALVDETGTIVVNADRNAELYLPDAVFGSGGVGVSGVLVVPDGTGTPPDSNFSPTIRPGESGLTRQIQSTGDMILFARNGAVETINVVDSEAEIPEFNFRIRVGESFIAREANTITGRSLVKASSNDMLVRLNEGNIYFLQADLTLSWYASQARLVSRVRDTVTLDGTEKLYFVVDGTPFTFDAAPLVITVGEEQLVAVAAVAAELATLLGATGTSYTVSGHIVIEAATSSSGTVEILYGATGGSGELLLDLSGCEALGFLPGWKVDVPVFTPGSTGDINWVPDNGTSVGLFRTVLNLNRSDTVADFRDIVRVEDELLIESVPASPFVFLSQVPLQDYAGYDENVFYRLTEGFFENNLESFVEVLYLFNEKKFAWLSSALETFAILAATAQIPLNHLQVVEETFSHVVDGFLKVSPEGSAYEFLEPGDDFLIDESTGTVTLIDRIHPQVAEGSRGRALPAFPDTFEDPDATFLTTAQEGYRLKILTGSAQGSYLITSVDSDTMLTITPPLLIAGPESLIAYQLFSGTVSTELDDGLVADLIYQPFNHLTEEPFKVHVLMNLGLVGSLTYKVNATRALRNNRVMFVRFGLNDGNDESSIRVLERTLLGDLANDSLLLPSTLDLLIANFRIQIGFDRFTPTLVLVFSPNPGAGAGIEYLLSGELKFGSTLLSDYEGASVSWVETFTGATDILSGIAELDPDLSQIRVSDVDAAANPGVDLYFGERMVSEDRKDVAMSPLSGTVNFNVPLLNGDIVESIYTQADLTGARATDDDGNPINITEFLPLFVRGEVATRVSDTKYTFNPTSRTVFQALVPVFYVDGVQRNFGTITDASIDFTTNQISLATSVEASAEVTISYAVLEAFGGETAYSVSTLPVYRPPFFLDAEASSFTLESDRTLEFLVNQVLRLGTHVMYITSATYDVDTDITTVGFFPPTISELGSRSPAHDLGAFLTDRTVIEGGFLVPVNTVFPDLAPVIFEPVSKGTTEVIFRGDLTRYAVPGHVVDLTGYPFTILSSELSEDGLTTRVSLGSATSREFNVSVDTIKISVRPIYPPDPVVFVGRDPVLVSEPFEIVLFGELNDAGDALPGRTLQAGVDYTLNPTASPGAALLGFNAPLQAPLQSDQTILFSFTTVNILKPVVNDRVVIHPRVSARFSFVDAPSEDNEYLNATLRGNYTFASPDSFYYRTVPVNEYSNEVVQSIDDAQRSLNPGFGSTSVGTDNQDFGSLGLRGQLQNRRNQDLVARRFLEFYNNIVARFEQVLETISGDIVGDRDGKFRFSAPVSEDRTTFPGEEDPITGELVSRNLWFEIFKSETSGVVQLIEEDPVVNPDGSFVNAEGELEGSYLDSDTFVGFLFLQNTLVRNDVDDILITGRRRATIRRWGLGLPVLEAKAVYQIMGEPHDFSRIFPELTLAFSTLAPGFGGDADSGDPGIYTFGRLLFGKKKRTSGKVIGRLSNPVHGNLSRVQDVEARNRKARARIWLYSETGFPELDIIPGYGTDFVTNPRPAVIATPLTMSEFPISNETGFPDVLRLISGGGDNKDLTTGDFDLSTPPFNGGEQITFGFPDGEIIETGYLVNSITISITGFEEQTRVSSAYIDEVFGGCVVTFKDDTNNPITDASLLVEVTGSDSGIPVALIRGDTLMVDDPTGLSVAPSDPPTLAELSALADANPQYRSGFDVKFRTRSGKIVDATLPSFKDPTFLGLKEILGQRPPLPLSTIEAEVEFSNSREEPLEIPALTGGSANDDGDYSLPYLMPRAAEIPQLRDAQNLIAQIIRLDTPAPLAVFPDEIIIEDGEVLALASGSTPPATLLTLVDVTPIITSGYTPNSGVGDLRPYDLLLVETSQAGIPDGVEGILSVGEVTGGLFGSTIEPPRFVTPTSVSIGIGYALLRAQTWVDTGHTTGVAVTEAPAGPVIETVLDVTTTTIVFDDGVGGGAIPIGGFNDYFDGADVGCTIVFNVIKSTGDPGPGSPGEIVSILEIRKLTDGGASILLDTFEVDGGSGFVPIVAGTLEFQSTRIVFHTAAGAFDFTSIASGTLHDFTVDVITGAVQSHTEFIEDDRLTFNSVYDVSTARVRGTTHPSFGATDLEAKLSVLTLTNPLSTALEVNSPAEINGGVPLTFLARDSAFNTVGTFPFLRGTIKAMGFEGHGNTPIPVLDMKLATVPSSSGDSTSLVIASSIGVADEVGRFLGSDSSNRVVEISPAEDLSRIEAGDILVIDGSSVGFNKATSKAGTYLVRYAVSTNDGSFIRKLSLTSGSAGRGFVEPLVFPTVVSFSEGGLTLTVTDSTLFPATGRVFVVLNESLLTATPVANYRPAVISASYTGNTGTTLTGLSTFQWADGTAIAAPATDFWPRISVDDDVTGEFTEIPVIVAHPTYPGVPGDVSAPSKFGFTDITIRNAGTTSTGVVTATEATPVVSTSFLPLDTVVYDEVPGTIDVTAFAGGGPSLWSAIHDPNGFGTDSLDVPLPGDFYSTVDAGGASSYEAQAGIFVEPSFPRSTINLSTGSPLVVDAATSLLASQVGMRKLDTFDLSLAPGVKEAVTWEVRRIRRFHDKLTQLQDALSPLRFLYEIRRGLITGYTQVGTFGEVSASLSTQLGDFDDPDVNINVGDLFRVIDSSGSVIEERTVIEIIDGLTLRVDTPGLLTPVVGKFFEIYLKQAAIPHEQTNEELFDIVVDEVKFTRTHDFTSQEGGTIDVTNELGDTDGSLNYTTLGINSGDFVIVDPIGSLEGPTGPASVPETGQGPQGDIGITPVTPIDQGGPSAFDDNRGYYEVQAVDPSTITVSPAQNVFGGTLGDNKIQGTPGFDYVVYPTVSASILTGGDEGQVDLRETEFADGSDSFVTDPRSVAPFSYRVVSVDPFVSRDTAELVFFMRERMLSWIEEVQLLSDSKAGSYFVFQRDEHIDEIEILGEPDTGLGMPSNAYLQDLEGVVDESPFVNNRDCLSVLDRRYWILDENLDNETPITGPPEYSDFAAGEGRPVLTDHIDLVLDQTEEFRRLRYAWLNFRTNQTTGTLQAIRRFEEEIPEQLKQQRRTKKLTE